ncbi:hypothetical protein [Prosthecobacter sp.]|uniref:hypothetical protein n=1 Tax=Prosthecobacter sp. TaxID=1965333 RepID=UPI003783ACAD
MNASELFVPGMWQCPQCRFIQQNNVISPAGVFASKAPELRPCPNDGRDMQPVTWREYAEQTDKTLGKILDDREALQRSLQVIYDLEADLKKEGMERFEDYFTHWNTIIRFAAGAGVSGYAQDPMELLATLVNQRDEARENLRAKLLEVAEKCFIAGCEYSGMTTGYAEMRWQESLTKRDLETECQLAPPGWQCTRDAGHEGPCAAVEVAV